MGKEEIPKLLKKSKKALATEHAASIKKIQKELNSFKKKTLSNI